MERTSATVASLIWQLLMGAEASPEMLAALASMLRNDNYTRVAVAKAGGIAKLIEICRNGVPAAQEVWAFDGHLIAH